MSRFKSALNRLHSVLYGILAAAAIVAAALGPMPAAFAAPAVIGATSQYSQRYFPSQQTHYLRFVVNFNSCPIRTGETQCAVKVGALPYNAFLVAISKQIITTFNPTTSATIALGTSGVTANIMAGFNVFTGQATTAAYDTAFTGAGELVTGAAATATGVNGGFDVYAVYTTGAASSQGTQGQAVFILQYFAPNDGACVLTSTAAC